MPASPSPAPLDPIEQFRAWLAEADRRSPEPDPTGMALATATPDGVPSVRFVLLKQVDARGFVFFTNLESRKARELEANPRASLAFHWPALGRQVRVEGAVEEVERSVSDAYFATRPVHSRVSAWASPQSRVIESRAWLETRVAEVLARHRHDHVPRPPFWGGYRLIPDAIEFWQSRPNRLHERLRCIREPGGWRRELLAP